MDGVNGPTRSDWHEPESPVLLIPTEDGRGITARRRQLMLVMLCAIYSLNYLDRHIIVILQEPIKQAFALQDWHLGLLTGAAFGIFYTVMGVPIAAVVDRGINRIGLIAVMLTAWSALTGVCGMARSYGQFFIGRMGVGLAESGFTPTAHALVSDLYGPAERPRALAVLSIGVPIGVMVGMSVGGLVAHYTSWRVALFVAGAPGLLAAVLFWAIAREPLRGTMETLRTGSGAIERIAMWPALRLLAQRASFIHVIAATAVTSFVETGISSWIPSYLIRTYGLPLSEVGPAMGLIAGTGGIIGTLAGGWYASRVGKRGMDHTLILPIVGLVLCIPLYLAVLHAGDGRVALALLALPTIAGAFWTAPAIALTQNLSPVATRARASAVRIVAANLVGVALGPLAVGALSDWFAARGGTPAEGLSSALLVFIALFAWATLHWLLAALALRRERLAELPAAAPEPA